MQNGLPPNQWGWSKRISILLRIATLFLLAIIGAGADIIVAGIYHYQPFVSYSGIVFLVVLLFLFLIIGLISRKYDRLARQKARDAEAARMLDDALQGTQKRFSLYLRSFDWTGLLPITNPTYQPDEDPFKELATLDLEEFLVRGVPGGIPVISLGLKGESIGAGKYTTDDSKWQEDVHSLAKRSVFILVMPLFSSGTMWEMEMLQHDKLLDKTIVVMPPSVGPFVITLRERWQRAKNKLAEDNIELPDYDESGRLFSLNSQGNLIKNCFPFPRTTAEVSELITKLLDNPQFAVKT